MSSVRLVRAEDRTRETTQTPGMAREEAFRADSIWSGYVYTAPGMTSGWHHHGDYDTMVYVVSGGVRMESGVGGREIVNAKSGDFIIVPKRTVHRESNPTAKETGAVVVRVGNGPPVINVDGPAVE